MKPDCGPKLASSRVFVPDRTSNQRCSPDAISRESCPGAPQILASGGPVDVFAIVQLRTEPQSSCVAGVDSAGPPHLRCSCIQQTRELPVLTQ